MQHLKNEPREKPNDIQELTFKVKAQEEQTQSLQFKAHENSRKNGNNQHQH